MEQTTLIVKLSHTRTRVRSTARQLLSESYIETIGLLRASISHKAVFMITTVAHKKGPHPGVRGGTA